VLRCATFHTCDDSRPGRAFIQASKQFQFKPGESLPGRVWRSLQPAWIAELACDGNFLRSSAASAAGLRSGLAFPILVGQDFFGVMEFFTERRLEPDRSLFQMMAATGSEIGQFIQRKRAEAARRQLSAVVEWSNDAIMSADRELRVASWNQGAERVFGYAAREMVGHSLLRLVPPDRVEEARAVLLKVWAGEAPEQFDTVCARRDGSLIHLSLRLSPIRDAAGLVMGLSAIGRDITGRKRQEEIHRQLEELEQENRRMQEATRLKSEFLAHMSHELRTPLNGIIGFSEFLRDEKPGPVNPKQKEYLGDVLNSSHHLLHLINDILDLSKIEAGEMSVSPEPFDAARAVEEVCAVARTLAVEKHLSLTSTVTLDPPTVVLDPAKFKQILYNLLSNAVKFTDHGTVEVRVSAPEPHCLRLAVMDTGIGIRHEDQRFLFVAFRQLDVGSRRRYQGTGLGLALTKQLVELQGGEITVQSAPGRGSTFTVELPLRKEGENHS
jgi:PAS domain S-box-containing protein